MKIIPRKRRRENKTNYLKRKNLLVNKKPRVVIRKTNRYILLQYVHSNIAQDRIIASLTSKELVKYGWPKDHSGSLKSLGAAYLTGYLFGFKLKAKKITDYCILDTGLIRNTKGSKIYACLKGMVDSGVDIGFNEKVFPSEKRIKTEKLKFFDKVKLEIGKAK